MDYVKLGKTNLKISRIGMGCWAIGGHGYGVVDDEQSIQTIRKAIELGVNFFDTADVYGFGHSEEILSRALGPQVKEVVIATKFGVAWDDQGRTFKDCSPERAQKALEDSLRRLKIDSIPLYQIHWYDDKSGLASVMETLLACQKAGKIQHIGCSNFSSTNLDAAVASGRLESYQCEYNFLQRKYESEMTRCSQELNMSVLAYRVLGRGLFSGKYDQDTKFGQNDTRDKDREFHGDRLKEGLRVVEAFQLTGKHFAKTPAQMAIRWVLGRPWVNSAIVGAKTPKQISENVEALDGNFSGIEEQLAACLS